MIVGLEEISGGADTWFWSALL